MIKNTSIKYSLLFLGLMLGFCSQAQIGGESTYQFLSIPSTARTAGLANSSLAVSDHDLNLSQYNPSLLDSTLDHAFSLNYTNYIKDIGFGSISYAKHISGLGTFSAGIQYFDYGTFPEADYTGFKTGEFSASDYAFKLTYARPLNNYFQMGVNLKMIYSDYYQNNSFGVALDGGITYKSQDNLTNIALVFQNFGHQLKPYREGNYENLPFDLQIGFAQKFAHAPFRLMFSIHNLSNWSLNYESPLDEENTILGVKDTPKEKKGLNKFGNKFNKFSNEFIRHVNIGVELTPIKNLYIRGGFNFQRYKELAIKDKFGMTGFTFGVGLRVYKFHISYSRAVYHLSAITHTFSITSNIREFIK